MKSSEENKEKFLGDMPKDEFRKFGYQVIDWIADYLENIEQYPVLPDVRPGDIRKKLPPLPLQAFLASTKPPQPLERMKAGVVAVAPDELQGVASDVVDGRGVDVFRYLVGGDGPDSGHLVHAAGAGAVQAQVTGPVYRHVPVLPADLQRRAVLGGPDVVRGDGISAHGTALREFPDCILMAPSLSAPGPQHGKLCPCGFWSSFLQKSVQRSSFPMLRPG